MIEFTKDLFIETLDALQKQSTHDEVVCSNLSKHFNCEIPEYENHWVNNQLIGILQRIFEDDHFGSWIEYYMNDLKFGKLSLPIRKDKNNNEVSLKSHGDLYELLISEK